MSNKPKPRLCPFKKIIEKEYSDRTGKPPSMSASPHAQEGGVWHIKRRFASSWREENEIWNLPEL